MTIELLLIAGMFAGLLASLLPSGKIGCGVLLLVPVAMIGFVYFELADPARRPDAQDALAYVFGPLWPSIGAIAGFALGRWVRRIMAPRRP